MTDGPDPSTDPTPHHDPRADRWSAPTADQRAARDPHDVRGALGGSRLFEQPRYRAEVERFAAFVRAPGPVAVEVGFDHGRRLLSLAESRPGTRWVGLEVRKRRVWAVAAAAQARGLANLLPWRADARTVFRRVIPPGRLSRVDVLFPTPWWHAGHRADRLLLTPAFVADVARALRADGVVHIATDVAPYFEHVAHLLREWTRVADPPPAPVPSRRAHGCARDGLPIHQATWRPPPPGAPHGEPDAAAK